MDTSCEPWNNFYQRDGDTECLLRRLQAAGALTEDEIVRDCLRDDEIRPLLGSTPAARLEREMISGLAEFVFSFGKSPAFSDAIRSSAEEINTLRRSLDWSQVPPHVRELARRRADCILAFAQEERFVEQDDSSARWRLSDRGRSLLAKGGFSMR